MLGNTARAVSIKLMVGSISALALAPELETTTNVTLFCIFMHAIMTKPPKDKKITVQFYCDT